MSHWSIFHAHSASARAELPDRPRPQAGALFVALCTVLLPACGDPASAPSNSPTAPADPSPSAVSATTSPDASTTEQAQPVVDPKQAFWTALQTLCDQRFSGQLTIGTEESDRTFGLADMTMYSKRCARNAIDIGFKVDDDDSRTWMFRRTNAGLSLHHRHVDASGKEDATSGYGGVSATPGTAERQEFPADENTGNMIPAAATNVWAVEVVPGEKFAYELQRIEEQRMFRVVFDLTQPLP